MVPNGDKDSSGKDVIGKDIKAAFCHHKPKIDEAKDQKTKLAVISQYTASKSKEGAVTAIFYLESRHLLVTGARVR